MPDVVRDDGNCPTCGQRVGTFTADDGSTYYLARAEQDASELEFVREQRDRYKAALERIASAWPLMGTEDAVPVAVLIEVAREALRD